MPRCVSVLLLCLFCFGGAGCGSIYQRTRAQLPPEPWAQLKFRVEEAQRTEKLAEQALEKLRVQLNRGLSGAAIEAEVDRVELAAFELERQGASVRDAAARCEGQTQFASEIERLHRRASELLEYVRAVRRGGYSAAERQLDGNFSTRTFPFAALVARITLRAT